MLRLPTVLRGCLSGQEWKAGNGERTLPGNPRTGTASSSNPLRSYFESHKEGRGIWKWDHYFDIYHRHLSRFVGREVRVLEIGIFSGGSLEMWKDYFGPKCRVYGVDIEEACKAYENDYTKVFVGDQADREFWKLFKKQVPTVDILIDDGGHQPEQQIVTLEEMLPHLSPDGVYLCEDVHGNLNRFAAFIYGLAGNLNAIDAAPGQLECSTAPFQSAIRSIHSYPFVTVIEKTETPMDRLVSRKQGTEWQPFCG